MSHARNGPSILRLSLIFALAPAIACVITCIFIGVGMQSQRRAGEQFHSLRLAQSLAMTAELAASTHAQSAALTFASKSWPGVSNVHFYSRTSPTSDEPTLAREAGLDGGTHVKLAGQSNIVAIPLHGAAIGQVLYFNRQLEANLFGLDAALNSVSLGLLLSLGISLVAGWITARSVFRQSLVDVWMRAPSAIFQRRRLLAIELCLAAVTGAIAVAGLADLHTYRQYQSDGLALANQRGRLESARTELELQYFEGKNIERPSAATILQRYGLESGFNLPSGQTANYGRDLLDSLDQELQAVNAKKALDEDAIDGALQGIGAIFLLTTVMGVLTIGLIHLLTRQQRRLEASKKFAEEALARYQQLSDYLPVGLFLKRGPTFEYANREWNFQFKRRDDEAGEDAWKRSVFDDDLEPLLEKLAHAERRGVALDTVFRIVVGHGQVRYIHLSGVPIKTPDGRFDHFLGFTLDCTEDYLGRRKLEEKHAELRETNSLLQRTKIKLEDNLEALVHVLVRAVEAKDPYTAGHSERVMSYSVRLGERLGFSPKELRTLELGSLVHDVGKIGIPDAVLLKPGPLTPEEFDIIRKHPEIGGQILSGITHFKEAIDIVRFHHERLDGEGYPYHLKGEAISKLVRVNSIADSFDAMTSDRAYRRGKDVATALDLLREDAKNGKLDPTIVEAFANMVNEEGVLWNDNHSPLLKKSA